MAISVGNPEPALPEYILIHAPWGYGKTFAAASASVSLANATKPPYHFRPHVILQDMIWVKVDVGALDGFPEAGLIVPKEQVVDATRMTTESLVSDLREIIVVLRKLADQVFKKGVFPQIVIDTASSIDVLMNAKWSGTIESNIETDSFQQRKDNNFAVYRTILNTWTPFWVGLNSINARKIILAHETVKGGAIKGEDNSARLKRQASGVTEAAVGASITGKAADLFHGNGSLVLMVDKIRKATPNGTIIERVFKQGSMDALTKVRYSCIGSVEPCDLNALFKKIEEAKK